MSRKVVHQTYCDEHLKRGEHVRAVWSAPVYVDGHGTHWADLCYDCLTANKTPDEAQPALVVF